MAIDIKGNLLTFLGDRVPEARYTSFDYCFNYFQEAGRSGEAEGLADKGDLLLSCLHLGFFLASWGMMRGSGDLYQRSVRDLAPVITQIASEPIGTWELDAACFTDNADEVLQLAERIRSSFSFYASDTLVTKTMLGTFGCVPAFDRYFRMGFGCSTLCKSALLRIGRFYDENQIVIDGIDVFTVDFVTGAETGRRYPTAKLIDMVHFQEGVKLERQKRQELQSLRPPR